MGLAVHKMPYSADTGGTGLLQLLCSVPISAPRWPLRSGPPLEAKHPRCLSMPAHGPIDTAWASVDMCVRSPLGVHVAHCTWVMIRPGPALLRTSPLGPFRSLLGVHPSLQPPSSSLPASFIHSALPLCSVRITPINLIGCGIGACTKVVGSDHLGNVAPDSVWLFEQRLHVVHAGSRRSHHLLG